MSLGALVSQAYTYSLSLIGLAAFIMLVYAGVRMIMGKRDEALHIIRDVVYGVILLLSAYLILYSINHDLVGQQTTITLPVPGQQTSQ